MVGKKSRVRTKRFDFRTDAANADHIAAQRKSGRFASSAAYINWLISQDRAGRDAGLQSLESRLVATIEGLEDELQSVRVNAATTNAFIHAFVKMYLVNTPEADDDTKKLAQSNAKRRYQRLLEQAAVQLQYDEGGQNGADSEE
jgi:Arc/MetJ-type ribon-helix-helix transcriptional regulator